MSGAERIILISPLHLYSGVLIISALCLFPDSTRSANSSAKMAISAWQALGYSRSWVHSWQKVGTVKLTERSLLHYMVKRSSQAVDRY